MDALAAGFWGFVGGASLLIGAVIGLYVGVPQRVIAIIAAAGAGVLVSSVAFELMEEAYLTGGFTRLLAASCWGLWPSSARTGRCATSGASTASALAANRPEDLPRRSP